MENRILDIHCPRCGAPAEYNVIRGRYVCAYCDGEFTSEIAQREKQGFRKMQGERLQESVKKYKLFRASCTGCGATVVFEENEALSNCAFCGRSLVRKEYPEARNMPESVIPFAITEDQAREQLSAWCAKNRGKPEAKKLTALLPELKGYYLPYEMVRGPVHMTASRMDGGSRYPCEGFLRDEFVNRSKQLDNLMLDGVEPFDTEAMQAFDFAYVAGHRVKIADISDKELEGRVRDEVSASCTPAVRKVLETKAVEVKTDAGEAVRMPVLLPVYTVCRDNLMAAVNGQTGKVSVRAEKVSHYYFIPWWLKAILAVLLFSGALFLALFLGGTELMTNLVITGMTALIFLMITLCLYSDTTHNRFAVESGRKVYTSGGEKRAMEDPVFLRNIDGVRQPVLLRFTTVPRVLKMVLLAAVALFLPVIVALLLNGFDFGRLELGGSAVWFCIAVPTVPIILLKYGVVQLYERPLVYPLTEKGKKKRYRPKRELHIDKATVLSILRVVFVPPASLAVWFAIISFFVMCWLTAFGFD